MWSGRNIANERTSENRSLIDFAEGGHEFAFVINDTDVRWGS